MPAAILAKRPEYAELAPLGEKPVLTIFEVARDAAAQGALSILPYFDEIAKQAGIET